jgi:Binding-protein-dependent transport system inner membrane component
VNWQAIILSLKLAVSVAGILLVVGVPIAYWVTFSRWRWKFLIEAIVALPIVLPPTVLGYYILVGLGPRNLPGRLWQSMFGQTLPFTFGGLLVASVLYSLPFAVQPISAGFETVDRRLIEAARTLGAWRRRADRRGAEFRAHHRRIRRGVDGRGKHSRRNAHDFHRHLRPGAGRELRRGESHGPGAPAVFVPGPVHHLRDEPARAEPLEEAIGRNQHGTDFGSAG